jgi:spermidine synthase
MTFNSQASVDPGIELVENGSEVSLLFDGRQAMQAWERDLMFASADLLCEHGSSFVEVGLGLGISAVRIAENPRVRRHVVVEKYKRVIDLFTDRHPNLPPTLEIVEADFFEYILELEPASLDGLFFDPFLPAEMGQDEALLRDVTKRIVAALKPGGAFIPFFTTRPELKWPFCEYFDRIIVHRHAFEAYPDTRYTHGTFGHAYVQCFIR